MIKINKIIKYDWLKYRRRSAVDGRRSVVDGQWSVVSSRQSAVGSQHAALSTYPLWSYVISSHGVPITSPCSLPCSMPSVNRFLPSRKADPSASSLKDICNTI